MKLKLLIASNQILCAYRLVHIISEICPDIKVVGQAYNGSEALAKAKKFHPEIILMDVKMPILDGLEVTEKILKIDPDTIIVLLSSIDNQNYLREALRLGAKGYLLKDISPEDLVSSIQAICHGTIQISSPLIPGLLENQDSKPIHSILNKRLESLSRREQEIIPFISKGMTNPEISEKLFVAEQTIKNHISKIYSKLGIHDRNSLIRSLKNLELSKVLILK